MLADADRRRPAAALLLALPIVAGLAACSADDYRRDADREVSEILDRKEERLFGKASGFTIETAHDTLRAQMITELERLRAERRAAMLETVMPPPQDAPIGPTRDADEERARRAEEGARAVQERLEARLVDVEQRHARELREFEATAPTVLPVEVLSLAEALQIASDNSREYQTQKEQVYRVALDLTFERYLFDFRFGVTSTYDWTSSPGEPQRTRDGELTTRFSVTKQLATGGLLVLDFTNQILKRFTGIEFSNGTNHSEASFIDLAFSQPLLRGFGADIAQEPLIQAERDVVYALRSFERFRQEFAVDIARDYFNLLQQLDQIENERRSYVQNIDAREQSEALAERGRRSQIQLDQAASSELNSRNSWIVAQRSYQDDLDRFKITLGLPMEANIAPDPEELALLRERGQPYREIDEERAIGIALMLRLDHANEVDQLTDFERRVKVAADALRAALDVSGAVSIPTVDDDPLAFRGSEATWSAGAALDLPVDRLAERNVYRSTLIDREVQARNVSLSQDTIKQDVRDGLRRLAQLRESYRIAVEAVAVAERRVQSTALTLRMGRIEVRDALEATDALTGARNQLTRALVDYEIARYELARDVGLLALQPAGIEIRDPPPEIEG